MDTAKPRLATSTLAVAAVFGLFFAYATWAAIGNAIRLADTYSKLELSAPWGLFILGIVVPVIVYAVVFLLGRRRPLLEFVIALFAGFALTCALGLGVVALNLAVFPGYSLMSR